MMLIFWAIRSYLKKIEGWDLWQKNNKTIFFRKVPILLKVSVVEYWDQLFWIPRIILHRKRSLTTRKKFIFNFFTQKGHFYHFCRNNLYRFYSFFCSHTQKLGYYQRFDFSTSWEYKTRRPSLCSTRLGYARSRFL